MNTPEYKKAYLKNLQHQVNMEKIYTEEFKKKLFNYDKQFIAVYRKIS